MVCKNCKIRLEPKLRGTKKVLFCDPACREKYYRKTRKELARTEWFSPQAVVEAARARINSDNITIDPKRGTSRAYTLERPPVNGSVEFYRILSSPTSDRSAGRCNLRANAERKRPAA
jgi:hypothetical protein